MKNITVVAASLGSVEIQDPFPTEGYFMVHLDSGETKTFEASAGQYTRIKPELDALQAAGQISSYTVNETEEERSDELLELKNRTAMVVTLNNTTLTNPDLVALGIRKGDVCNVYVALTGVTTPYTVDEVHTTTIFTATGTVVAWDIHAPNDAVYFARDGVEIATSRRTIPAIHAGNNLIGTVSQSPYQRTGFGRFFVKAVDGKPYFLTGAGVELNLGMTGSDPLIFKGAIAASTDFPLLADVKVGWLYRVTADVTDSGGGGRTGTTQSFLAGAEIAWNGTGGVTGWSELGTSSGVQEVHAAGAFTLPAGSSTTFVDTSTAAAGTSCTLPAASATKFGEVIAVGDYTGDAAAHNITIGRTGGDTIDGVAANLVLNKNNIFVALECVSATGWKTIYRSAPVSSAATPQAIGVAAAGTSLVCSPDDHVHAGVFQQLFENYQGAAASEPLRVFRALKAGTLIAVTAETGTVAAAGETMTFMVLKNNAVNMLSAVVTINSTIVIDTPVPGSLSAVPGAIDFAVGDLISVDRVYVAGGGATPMRDTAVGIQVQYSL
jgi:hypothetical protein